MKKADVLKIMKDYDREEKGKISFQDFSEVSKWITSRYRPPSFPRLGRVQESLWPVSCFPASEQAIV